MVATPNAHSVEPRSEAERAPLVGLPVVEEVAIPGTGQRFDVVASLEHAARELGDGLLEG